MADELLERALAELRGSAAHARRTLSHLGAVTTGQLQRLGAVLATPTRHAAQVDLASTQQAVDAALERASDVIRRAIDAEVRALGGTRFGPADTERLAAAFHDQWRRTTRRPVGDGFEPRPKTTTDAAWIAAHGTETVDIANTSYADLPVDWQRENRDAAAVVLDLVDLYTEAVGRAIHEEWLQRNPEVAGTALGVDFGELPAVEREKNIALAIAVARALDGGPAGADAGPELDELAAAIHAQWQESRRSPGGVIPPRPKVTIDIEWMERHHTAVVDLATTSFAGLPRDWQDENRQAAHYLLGLVRRNSVAIGRAIHQAWLSRNPWATDTELDVSFSRLIEGERDKDLAQFRTALRLLDSLGAETSQAS